MDNGKVPGIEYIMIEKNKIIQYKIKTMVSSIFSVCLDSALVPKMWKKAKVVDLPKPGNNHENPKSYRLYLCYVIHPSIINPDKNEPESIDRL